MPATNFNAEEPAARSAEVEARRFGAGLLGVFLLLAVLLGVGSYFYLAHRQAEARATAYHELSAIADLKLKQLREWREERLSDARFFSRARFVAQDVERFFQHPEAEPARAAVLHWLDLLKGGERYSAAIVLDGQFQRRLALPDAAPELPASARPLLEQAVSSRSVVLGDLHREQTNGPVYLDIVFPVFAQAEVRRGALLAVVVLKLDAHQFLFPFVQTWPAPSRSAETLLIRRDGTNVLYLNEVRHRPETALRLRVPLATPDLPAAKVLRGETNVLAGVDYRGVPVLATGHPVPGTPWAMVCKVDREEVYAPLRQQTLAALAVVGMLLVAGALLVALLWRQRSAGFLAHELAERKAHEAALARVNRLYAALSRVNGAVVRAHSREELLPNMCCALTEAGGFTMVWIGWVDAATQRVMPLAQCGDTSGYLQHIQVYADDRLGGRGPVGLAIRTGRAQVCNDILKEPGMAPFREAAVRAGWRALAAFPVRQEGQIGGALAVYASEPGVFGPQELALLEEAAGDVSFGLDVSLNRQRREQAEEQLRLQAAALYSAANAILISNAQGRIEWVNPAFERLTGYPLAEVVGQTPRVLKSGRQSPEFFKGMWETIAAGKVWHGELVNRRKDGRLYYEEMTVTPVQDARGATTHFVAIKQDVSERKQAEQSLQEARDALARANAELEQKVRERTAQLVDANSNLQTFAHTAAHDMRSPLRAILGFSKLVLEESGASLPGEGRTMLERVVASANQMNSLLNDLLEYSKMTQAELRLEPVDLRQAVSEALALLDGDIRSKNALVTVADPVPSVVGHPATVALLINNFVSNALKFMPPEVQPRVRLWAENRGGERPSVEASERGASEHATRNTQHAADVPCVRLWVEDNGIGIAPEHQEKIFGAFERLHGKQAFPGTGLGLAIVRKGAERMGGQVGVESVVGQGSRFWLELRAAEP